jgi:hypothetical protein
MYFLHLTKKFPLLFLKFVLNAKPLSLYQVTAICSPDSEIAGAGPPYGEWRSGAVKTAESGGFPADKKDKFGWY